MVIPNFCPDPAVPCCTSIYDSVRCLVDAAADAVTACIGEALCKDFGRSVHIGPPVGPGDYVAGWVGRIVPAPSAQNRSGAKQLLAPRLLAPINIRLVESDFPVGLQMVGERIALPKREELDYVSWHFYGHAEKVTRGLINAASSACGKGCESIRLVSSEAMQPETAWMAWNWVLEATMRW